MQFGGSIKNGRRGQVTSSPEKLSPEILGFNLKFLFMEYAYVFIQTRQVCKYTIILMKAITNIAVDQRSLDKIRLHPITESCKHKHVQT